MRGYLFVTAVLLCTSAIHANVQSCTYKDPSSGKTYDFTPLVNPGGYYMFSQQVWDINDFSLDSLAADSQVNITFYLQICRNILTPPPACEDEGAIYSVTADGKCQSWGDTNVATFDLNPYKDGVNMKLYHGTAVDHISNNAAIIYFVCNQNKKNMKDVSPMFEHVKGAINQAHFKIPTSLAC